MMNLKVELDQFLDTKATIRKKIPIDSEDMNLIKCIESVVGEDCYISFKRYYGNINRMKYERAFPYIIADETIQWCVPFSDVTIREFRDTHNLDSEDVINAEICDLCGCGSVQSELISWIVSNWDVITTGIGTVSSSITIAGFIRKIYKYFANKRNDLPYFGDLKEVVERNDTWERNELMKLLKVDDAELMDCISNSIGYKKIDNLYVKMVDESETVSVGDSADSIWGLRTCNRWTADITASIHILNQQLTELKYRAESLDSDCLYDIDEIINQLIDKWESYLVHGENLCFIKLIDSPQIYDRNKLERDINAFGSEVEELLNKSKTTEKRNEFFLQNDTTAIICDSSKDTELNECEGNEKSYCDSSCRSEEVVEVDSEWIQESDNDCEFDYEDEDNEIDDEVSPWEILLTRLLLKNQLSEIIMNHEAKNAYVKQVYDDDVLLQLLSEDGIVIGYQACNYYDINMIITDTNKLNTIEENVPKGTLPTLFAYGMSAMEFIFDYALENNLILEAYIRDISESPITGKVVEIEEDICSSDDPLVKMQLLNKHNKYCGNAWIELSSVEWVSLDSIE